MTTAEPDSFEALCRSEYSNIVKTALLITGDLEEAKDLAQEAFSRAFERWDRVSRLERPGAWLQTVVTNLAISWRRKQRVRLRSISRMRPPAPSADEGSEVDVLSALQALTPAERSAVVLRFYADLPYEQVADALHKKPGTVRALTSRGVSRMRQLLGEEERTDV
ncbi:MAG: SigE family RNA polymerase sigma factor [Actinobacteria bacterium]|nr:SigE family RNA polymerase sigma factor [Actinomycetota bacterium]